MKHFAIRTFVLVLAVAGFSASSVFSVSAASQAKTSRPTIVLAGGGPAPLCPPNGSQGLCGID
jgi:hypothetical protein